MKAKIIQRLLIFFLGVPAVLALVILLPHNNHFILNIFIVIVSSIGAVEFALMLKAKGFPVYILESAILGSLSPAAATLIVSFGTNGEITLSLFIIGAIWVLFTEIFYHKSRDDFSLVLNRLSGSFSVMIYPGLLLSWIVNMSALAHSTVILITFFLAVFANDSLAWVTGMLLGKNNRGIFSVSPNKSIAGYIGGMIGSIAVCIAFGYFFPEAFIPDQIAKMPSVILLGFLSGIAVILGDLAESAIKRGSGFKDSGIIIPGRGGVLDSTDSIAFTAPIFYVLYRFFF